MLPLAGLILVDFRPRSTVDVVVALSDEDEAEVVVDSVTDLVVYEADQIMVTGVRISYLKDKISSQMLA